MTPGPRQTAATRSKSVSKHIQQSCPRFRTIPRGVRLFAAMPVRRASRMDEKNGKSGSTHAAHGEGTAGLLFFGAASLTAAMQSSASVMRKKEPGLVEISRWQNEGD